MISNKNSDVGQTANALISSNLLSLSDDLKLATKTFIGGNMSIVLAVVDSDFVVAVAVAGIDV